MVIYLYIYALLYMYVRTYMINGNSNYWTMIVYYKDHDYDFSYPISLV